MAEAGVPGLGVAGALGINPVFAFTVAGPIGQKSLIVVFLWWS